MSTLPDTSNMVMMTVNDLIKLQEKAEDTPRQYTFSDAIGGVIGLALIGGGAYLACTGLRGALAEESRKTKDIQRDIDNLRARIEALQSETGK